MLLTDQILKYRKTACLLAGAGTAAAFATYPVFPAILLLGVLLIAIHDEPKPLRAAMLCFLYSVAFFAVSLYWVQNALAVSMNAPPYARAFVLVGLPLLLVPLWMLAGWLSTRLTKPSSHARSVLFVTLLALAEYGRAWLFTGFPWNLFAGAWANVTPLMQVSAIGGVFFLNALTLLWALTPAMAWLGRADRKFMRGVLATAIGSFVLCFAYGAVRLAQNPTVLRDDAGAVVVQPNIPQHEKWDGRKVEENFKKHIALSKEGLQQAKEQLPSTLKTISVIWPETSLIEDLVFQELEVSKLLLEVLRQNDTETFIVSGLMRMGEIREDKTRDFHNSIVVMGDDDGLSMDDLYDKAHLVPFGEYIPLTKSMNIRPVTGFANFLPGGYGPKVLHAPASFPPVAAIVCFEAIFPWAIDANDSKGDAEWIVNVSNDGWYGDTMGPRQHLAMTRLRAIEQGLPILRSTTTGISAVIDSYGRELHRIDYGQEGQIITALPAIADDLPLYRSVREAIFYLLIGAGLALSFFFRKKDI